MVPKARLIAPTRSPSTFWVAVARMMWRMTQRFTAAAGPQSGRSTSQNRIRRVMSLVFSAVWT